MLVTLADQLISPTWQAYALYSICGITLLLFIYLSIKKPVYALGLLIMSLPLYQLRLSVIDLPTNLLEIMFGILLVIHFIIFPRNIIKLLSFLGRKIHSAKYLFVFLTILTAFVVISFIATLCSPDLYHALGHFRAFMLEPFLFFGLCLSLLKNPRDLKIFNKFLIGLVGYVSLLAIVQYFGKIFLITPWDGIEESQRATAPFFHPNYLALFLAPLWVYVINLYLSGQRHLLIKLALVASLLALVLTFSYGALVAVLIASFFIGYVRFPRLRSTILILAIILLILFSTSYLISDLKITSLDERIVMWRGTLSLLTDHPLRGAGLANFPALYEEFRLPQHIVKHPYPHNLYLALYSETSLFGLISFISAIYFFFIFMLNKAKKHRAGVLTLAPFLVILIHGLVDTPYFKNDLAIIFYLLIALSLLTSLSRTDDCQPDS